MTRLVISLLVLYSAAVAASHTMTKDEAIRLAREALRTRVGTESEILVRSADAVEWPGSSLGCPREGAAYARGATPGYRVVLLADLRPYRVHAGAGRAEVCDPLSEAGSETAPELRAQRPTSAGTALQSPEDPETRRLVEQAREDLAKRLSVDPDLTRLVEIRKVTWRDSSLGCPRPGMSYRQALAEGLMIRLQLDRRIYQYHAGVGGRPFLCETPAADPTVESPRH